MGYKTYDWRIPSFGPLSKLNLNALYQALFLFFMSTDVDTNPPRNSVAKGGWWTIFGLGFVTWGFAVASIGIGKHEHRILRVRYNSRAPSPLSCQRLCQVQKLEE
jgi:hypothetical protein